MERRRTVGGNPETIVHRLVQDVAPDVEEDEADFVHSMFAQFDENSHIDELVDPDSERQLQLSQEPLSLIGLFSQEGSTPSSTQFSSCGISPANEFVIFFFDYHVNKIIIRKVFVLSIGIDLL